MCVCVCVCECVFVQLLYVSHHRVFTRVQAVPLPLVSNIRVYACHVVSNVDDMLYLLSLPYYMYTVCRMPYYIYALSSSHIRLVV